MEIDGRVVKGLGEGSHYVQIPEYKNQFIERLGFTPYPGTLNLRVKEGLEALGRREGIEVEGFTKGGRSFGPVKCFKARIGGIAGAVVIPARGRHAETLEFIAPVKVREVLKLADGDVVRIELL
ncbi:MAG: DUF120 domain-containing protein [Candidatus Hydrothermarchaeota archaeon]